MPNLRKVEKHTAKANYWQTEADDALREAMAFGVSGPDEEGNYTTDNKNARRMLKLHVKLVERARREAEKAVAATDNVEL